MKKARITPEKRPAAPPAVHLFLPWILAAGVYALAGILMYAVNPRASTRAPVEALFTVSVLILVPYLLQGAKVRLVTPYSSRATFFRFAGVLVLMRGLLALGWLIGIGGAGRVLASGADVTWHVGEWLLWDCGTRWHVVPDLFPIVAWLIAGFLWLTINWILVAMVAFRQGHGLDRSRIAAIVSETQPALLLGVLSVPGAPLAAIGFTFFLQKVFLDRSVAERPALGP